MMIDKKAYQAALNNHLPLFWEYKSGWYRLNAVTAQFESGKLRTRKLYSIESAETAITASLELLKSWDGRLDVANLFENICGLPLLGELRTAVSNRPCSSKQPDWEGFAEEMRKGR